MASVVMISANFHPYLGERRSRRWGSRGLVRPRGRSHGAHSALRAWREETVDGVVIRRLPAWGRGLVDSTVFMVSAFLWLLTHLRRFDAVHVISLARRPWPRASRGLLASASWSSSAVARASASWP